MNDLKLRRNHAQAHLDAAIKALQDYSQVPGVCRRDIALASLPAAQWKAQVDALDTELQESGQTGTDGSQKPNDADAIRSAKTGFIAMTDVIPRSEYDRMLALQKASYERELYLERLEALEEAAKLADRIEQQHWNDYKGRYIGPHPRPELRGNQTVEGMSDGAGQVACAIRALMVKDEM